MGPLLKLITVPLLVLFLSSPVLVGGQNTTNAPPVLSGRRSPIYNQEERLISIQATALVAALASGIAGHANTAAMATRPLAILNACKSRERDAEDFVLRVPVAAPIGPDEVSAYAAGNAVLNLPALVGLFLLLGATIFIAARAVDTTMSSLCALSRFPGFLMPFLYYFSFQTVSGATTLATTATASATLATVGGVFSILWIAIIGLITAFTVKGVPSRVTYVANFSQRISSAHDDTLTDLRRSIRKYQQTYALAKPRRRPRAGSAEAPSSIAGSAIEGSATEASDDGPHEYASDADEDDGEAFGGKLRSAINDVVSLLFAGSDTVASLANRSPQAAERERQRVNCASSALLDTELRRLAKQHSALSEILSGKDRWEDKEAVGPGGRRMSARRRSSVWHRGTTSFVRCFGIAFERYREDRQWFGTVEAVYCLACGFVQGWVPANDLAVNCNAPAAIILTATWVHLGLLILLKPHISWFEELIARSSAVLLAVSSLLFMVALHTAWAWAELGAYLFALCVIYILILKALLDSYDVAAKWVEDAHEPWPDTEGLTRQFIDMKRRTCGRQKVRRHVLASISELTDEERARLTEEERMAGLVSKVVVDDEGGDDAAGGVKDSFVSSRGVPIAMLPFHVNPLPDFVPLPQRTTRIEDRKRAFERQARENAEKRRLWESVKHLFTEQQQVDLAQRDRSELIQLAEEARGSQGKAGPKGGQRRREMQTLQVLDDVREAIVAENRRNEEVDEARRRLVDARVAETDIPKEAFGEPFFDDGTVDLKDILFRSENPFEPPSDVVVQNRSMNVRPDFLRNKSFGNKSMTRSFAGGGASALVSPPLRFMDGMGADGRGEGTGAPSGLSNMSIFGQVLKSFKGRPFDETLSSTSSSSPRLFSATTGATGAMDASRSIYDMSFANPSFLALSNNGSMLIPGMRGRAISSPPAPDQTASAAPAHDEPSTFGARRELKADVAGLALMGMMQARASVKQGHARQFTSPTDDSKEMPAFDDADL